MQCGGLFSGILGFELGFHRAGIATTWLCENAPPCQQVIKRHLPGVPLYGDVADLLKQLEGKRAARIVRPDIVCGGFPCQDVSVAGRGAGLAGKRSGLWFAFRAIVERLAPRWVVVENVPGLLSSNNGRDMGTVLGGLGQLGYGWAYRCLDAQWFGVAQRRRRVFVVGCLGDARRAAEVLFERDRLPWDPAPGREAGSRAAACLTRGTGSGRQPGRRQEDDFNIVEAQAPVQAFGGNDTRGPIDVATACMAYSGRIDFETETLLAGPLMAHSVEHGHAMTTQQAVEAGHLVAYACQGTNVGPAGRVGGDNASRGVPFVVSENQRGEVLLQEKAGLKCGGGKPGQGYGAVLEQAAVRRLMPVECERLQAFPDGWTELGADGKRLSDSARYRMLGNAVCVNVAHWLGCRLVRAENL